MLLKPYKKRALRNSTRKRCPICHKNAMRASGRIRAGPRNGFRTVYVCKNCGYRSLR